MLVEEAGDDIRASAWIDNSIHHTLLFGSGDISCVYQ